MADKKKADKKKADKKKADKKKAGKNKVDQQAVARVLGEIEKLSESLRELSPEERKKVAKPLKKLLLAYAAGDGDKEFDDMLFDAAVDKVFDFLTDEIF
ncbi:hypothetical protein [Amycolatopsis jiangsuensis]|uniref:Uncharacterized protein n=1 Tax=Amycolatopsis jiangsuensis TaxID=1181879 RepID=A0A840IPD5_9PSEU|nr:hypothetical protein [Amycolatopsis jiangsuensis]MBB4683800.1 hypothetical protein [Amycolatopsis jiangsuensis]